MICLIRCAVEKMGFNSSEFCQQWKNLTWVDLLKVSINETVMMTRYGILPALLCTVNALLGFDNLVLLWILSIVTAYVIHKKQLEPETIAGLFSPAAVARYITFFLIAVKCSWLNSYLIFPKEFESADEIPYRFLSCHAKVTANVALYRFYLTFCGVFKKVAKKKFQKVEKNSVTSTPDGKGDEVVEEKKCQ